MVGGKESESIGLLRAVSQVVEISRHELEVPAVWCKKARLVGWEGYKAMVSLTATGGVDVSYYRDCGKKKRPRIYPSMVFDEIGESNGRRVGRIRPIEPVNDIRDTIGYAYALYHIFSQIGLTIEQGNGYLYLVNTFDVLENGTQSIFMPTQKPAGYSSLVCLREELRGMLSAAKDRDDSDFAGRVGSWNLDLGVRGR